MTRHVRPGLVYRVGDQGARIRLADATVHDFTPGHLIRFGVTGTVVSGEMFAVIKVDPATYETQDRRPRTKSA